MINDKNRLMWSGLTGLDQNEKGAKCFVVQVKERWQLQHRNHCQRILHPEGAQEGI
jgi:hypothetical protein